MKKFFENLREGFNIDFKAAVMPVNAPSNNFAIFIPKKFLSAAMTISAHYNLNQ